MSVRDCTKGCADHNTSVDVSAATRVCRTHDSDVPHGGDSRCETCRTLGRAIAGADRRNQRIHSCCRTSIREQLHAHGSLPTSDDDLVLTGEARRARYTFHMPIVRHNAPRHTGTVALLAAATLIGCATGPASATRAGNAIPESIEAAAKAPNTARAACPTTRPTASGTREWTPTDREHAIRRPDFSPPPQASSLASLLQHFDASLLAFWTAATGPGERTVRVVHDSEGKPDYTLCGYLRDRLVRSFAIRDSVEPAALVALSRTMRPVAIGRLTALVDSALSPTAAQAVADTLAKLEQLLGVQDDTPLLAFLFADQTTFAARFPIGWNDGVYSDWTLSEPGIGAAVFAAARANGIASHELVHVALKSVHAQVDVRGSSIPYVAEEALARTIGGSRGRSYRELIGPITLADARRIIAREMQDGALSAVRFDSRRPYEPAVDALGAVYRVAISACRAFPADLLDARAVTTLSAAVNRLAIHLRVTPDAAVDSMALRLANAGNVFEPSFRRPEALRFPCVPYAVPLERAHPP